MGSFVPGLTKKAFEKHGFAAATLLTDWETIVGRELASYTVPERLKWPRMTGSTEADPDGPRPGGTLHLRVDPARALDVEYRARQIAERINAYFGYRASRASASSRRPCPKSRAQRPESRANPRQHPRRRPLRLPRPPCSEHFKEVVRRAPASPSSPRNRPLTNNKQLACSVAGWHAPTPSPVFITLPSSCPVQSDFALIAE